MLNKVLLTTLLPLALLAQADEVRFLCRQPPRQPQRPRPRPPNPASHSPASPPGPPAFSLTARKAPSPTSTPKAIPPHSRPEDLSQPRPGRCPPPAKPGSSNPLPHPGAKPPRPRRRSSRLRHTRLVRRQTQAPVSARQDRQASAQAIAAAATARRDEPRSQDRSMSLAVDQVKALAAQRPGSHVALV